MTPKQEILSRSFITISSLFILVLFFFILPSCHAGAFPQREIYLTTNSAATIEGVSFENEDIVKYDPVCATVEIIFDGSTNIDRGVSETIDAVSVLDYDGDGTKEIIYSCQDKFKVSGATFQPDDVVLWDPDTGATQLLLARKQVFKNRENIDAVSVVDWDGDGNWEFVLSTARSSYINGNEKILPDEAVLYDPDTGTKTKLFCRQDIFKDAENIVGIDVLDYDGDGMWEYALSLSNLGFVGSIRYDDEDIMIYDPDDGSLEVIFDGSEVMDRGKKEVVFGLSLERDFVMSVHASAEPERVYPNEAVNFSAQSSDPDAVVSYSWDFGNGETSDEQNPVHFYSQEGVYTATVEVVDTDGDTASDQVMITVQAELMDFEGFGAGTTGGEGYETYTAGSASEFSSIIETIKSNGGNAVVNLGGDWTYSSNVRLTHLNNITLNGLNSLVTFDGSTLYFIDCNNIILQGLRVRMHQSGDDCIQINSCENVMIDHCSVSEAGDGNIDITGWSYGASKNITVSWCILADTWKQSLVKYNGTTNITFHHNLYYNSGIRTPHVSEGIFDFRNNVIWQWGSTATALAKEAMMNIISNYYKEGTPERGRHAIFYRDLDSRAWIEGNILPHDETDASRLSGPLDVPPVTTHSAEEAKAMVLDHAGAAPRDPYDEQVIYNVRHNIFPELPPCHD